MNSSRFIRRKILIPTGLVLALLVALGAGTVSGQEATPSNGEEEVRIPPGAGPAPEPAIPGALEPGIPALPKRIIGGEGGGGLRIVVGPTAKQPDPIAVPDALCGEGSDSACKLAVDVIRNDLRLSGYFNVLPPKTYIADMEKESLTNTKWSDWMNVGATYLIKVKVSGKGPYDLDFRLYNVVDKRVYGLDKQHREKVGADDLRLAVHEFCNQIVELVSGAPGVFHTRILFAVKARLGSRGIAVIDMDGYNEHVVIGADSINMLPSWAPGGGVLYTSYRSGKPDIWLGKKRLSKGGRHFRKARFAPDGSVAAVSVNVEDQSEIFLMAPDGTLQQNLTKHWGDDVSPAWSPDGSQIAFVSNRAGGPQVYVMNRDGSGQRRLTMAGSYNSTPDWGPNGLIVFAGMDEGHSDIFTVDLGGAISRLTQDQGNNKDPSWAPNGRYVAFVSDREGKNRVWIMTSDGRYQFRIGELGGAATTAWQR